ncbi:MAG TPA: hypothetical protein VN408_33470 [Actinoplanes sp.]|nr:hypothetical protein [Actinoplanes sp.]
MNEPLYWDPMLHLGASNAHSEYWDLNDENQPNPSREDLGKVIAGTADCLTISGTCDDLVGFAQSFTGKPLTNAWSGRWE